MQISDAAWKVGDKIENRYEIHKILGGGMGVVYICYDHESETPLALKTFQDRYLQSQQIRERFRREAEIWVALEKHQNIVRAEAVQNIQNKSYIFLEYIANPEMSGADLSRWIRRGMEVTQALNFAVQFCDGMEYAHKKVGMVHRDIKPGNILVTQDKVVKITDFGLVKTALAETAGEDFPETPGEKVVSGRVAFTHSGALGTPPYMSPEQWLHPQQADMRSDIYSFGVVLYEMLTGRWVFKATTLKAFKDCHLDEPPPSPASVVPSLPRNLEAVVLRCLAKDPEQRYPDFAMLREELAEIYRTFTGEEIAPPVGGEALEAWEWSNKGVSLAALGRKEEAIHCYERALEIAPRLAQAWYNKGYSLADVGRTAEALHCYERALAIDPGLAQAWSEKGISLANVGRTAEALHCYERALAIDPGLAQAWSEKGISLANVGRTAEALHCYERALAINPRFAPAWTNKGLYLAALGREEEAIACHDRALESDPENAIIWLNKGASLGRLGLYNEASHCFDQALAIDPENAIIWHNKGISLADVGRTEEASYCFGRALVIDPENVSAWLDKGTSLASLGRKQEAIACYDRALVIDPRLAQAWLKKGNALTALGRNEEALHCYDQALEINSSNANAWFNKGAIFANSGRFRKALDYFSKALEIDPYLEPVKQAIVFCQQHLK